MGIQGLIPFLQKCSRKVEMSEFSGCTVAVDVYCWLHKGVFSCAEKIARGEDTDQYVHFCMKYINMLAAHNIKVILVFDGCHLPAKAETEKTRRERREATKKKAGELLRADKGEEARQLLRRCVDVTHAMAHKLILKARAANVDCIVAPFEADAQLAYLNLSGMAHFIITEDSDLLLFGCTKVVFKLDIGGAGLLVEQTMLPIAMKMSPEQFSLDKFRQMCILSGCDYLSSLPGIGLSKACKFVKLTSQPDISKILHKIGSYLSMPKLLVPEEYKYNFVRAEAMFKHQPVFDPQKRKVVPLTPVDEGTELHLPRAHPPDLALQLALGNVDPITLKVVDDWDPDKLKDSMKQRSIWSSIYRKPTPEPSVKLKPLPPVTTYGKRLSVSTHDILPVAKKSEEAELEEMRAMWGVAKKSRLEKLNDSEENMADLDELVDPSPPRLNPFKVTQGISNVPLTPTTSLSKLTSPSETVSKYFDLPSTPLSQQPICDKQSKSATPLPIVISRYFADSSSPAVKNSSNSTPNGLTDKLSNGLSLNSPQPIVIPESPCKAEITPKKRNITVASSPLSKLNEIESSQKPITGSNGNKKGRSLLSALEDEDGENMYKCSQPASVKITNPSGLSCFKWKPLGSNDKLSSSQKSDRVSGEELFLDTPPCSQETESQPVKIPHLEQARKVGLSKNKSAAMQTFLSKFKFEPKSKLKKK